jgi:hypothetical protein
VSTTARVTPARGGALAQAWTILFFAAMAVVLLLLVTKAQTSFLPAGLASRVGHNSEVFALALLATAAILARRRVPPPPLWLHGAVAVVLLALGFYVFYGPVGPTVKTLNEPIFASAAVWLYVVPRRPIPLVWLASVVLALVIAVGYHTSLITLQAESLVVLVLAPLVLDVTDRRLLDPTAPERPVLRWAMIAFLVLFPVLLIAFLKSEPLSGLTADFAKYCSRGTEGFWGLAVIELYFVVRLWLERSGARAHRRGSHQPV